jgi:hypothetical protein
VLRAVFYADCVSMCITVLSIMFISFITRLYIRHNKVLKLLSLVMQSLISLCYANYFVIVKIRVRGILQ